MIFFWLQRWGPNLIPKMCARTTETGRSAICTRKRCWFFRSMVSDIIGPQAYKSVLPNFYLCALFVILGGESEALADSARLGTVSSSGLSALTAQSIPLSKRQRIFPFVSGMSLPTIFTQLSLRKYHATAPAVPWEILPCWGIRLWRWIRHQEARNQYQRKTKNIVGLIGLHLCSLFILHCPGFCWRFDHQERWHRLEWPGHFISNRRTMQRSFHSQGMANP